MLLCHSVQRSVPPLFVTLSDAIVTLKGTWNFYPEWRNFPVYQSIPVFKYFRHIFHLCSFCFGLDVRLKKM